MSPTCRVLIVCSVHYETGNATAGELHWLLGRLRPEVLFLEHSAADFAAFLDGSYGTLESAAVMRYRERNAVELVPVDLHLPDAAELKPTVDAMFDRIREASPQYCQLELENRHHANRGGLAFLNSPLGALLRSKIEREMRATVDALSEPMLTDAYARWTRMNHLRELAMIGGVEEWARRNSFDKGVLIVGSAHRIPLFEKLRERSGDVHSPVAWEFDWELEDSDPDGDPRPDAMGTDRTTPG